MERNSKVAIYKLKIVKPKDGEKFYLVTLVECIKNTSKCIGGIWESVFYPNVYIFDTSHELEEAKFDKESDSKDKFSFSKISNPDKCIIRVIDFKFEYHSCWDKYEKKAIKGDNGKVVYKPVFYIQKYVINDGNWKSETFIINQLNKKIESLNLKIDKLKEKINNLTNINNLNKATTGKKSAKKIIAYEKLIKKLKADLKQSNKSVMVYKRKNTITGMKLDKQIEKTKEKEEEVIEIKKMKKAQIIEKVNDIEFDFGEM